jgi:hypothetical protein
MQAANRLKFLSARSHRGENLPQCNSAIIWRYALMPIDAKAFGLESLHCALGQITILKTSAGQRNLPFTHVPRNFYGRFH